MKFERGYNLNRERVMNNVRYNRSCFNCDFYYQAVGDKEEVCQNDNVSKYDMTVTENNAYCIYWAPIKGKKDKSLFKKRNGRSILD